MSGEAPIQRLEVTLAEVERAEIVRVLTMTGGNVSEAARLLGLTRKTLQRRIGTHTIDVGQIRARTTPSDGAH